MSYIPVDTYFTEDKSTWLNMTLSAFNSGYKNISTTLESFFHLRESTISALFCCSFKWQTDAYHTNTTWIGEKVSCLRVILSAWTVYAEWVSNNNTLVCCHEQSFVSVIISSPLTRTSSDTSSMHLFVTMESLVHSDETHSVRSN